MIFFSYSGFSRIFKFTKPSLVSNVFYGRHWVIIWSMHRIATYFNLIWQWRIKFTSYNLQVYFWVIGSNLVLRGSWTYKLSAHLRHNYLTVFGITLLEMFRRFQWVFFRVENEWNKITRAGGVQLTEVPREDEKLLGSNIYDV